MWRIPLLAHLLALSLAAQSPLANAVAAARAELQAGNAAQARRLAEEALEYDDRSIEAWLLVARAARQAGDQDSAVHALHSWLDLVDAARPLPVAAKEHDAIQAELASLDPKAGEWNKLQRDHLQGLLALARDYRKRKDWLGALEVLQQARGADPRDTEGERMLAELRRSGGREVAVEDLFAGGDPGFGKTPEQIETEDRMHADWEHAWTKQTENYSYRTDAGFLVLETSAIAMEQVNRFYRRFFRFQEDGGKLPPVEVRIFKSRDEYLALGRSPAAWSGGQFTGDAVETYIGGVTGNESIRDMYRTLFHEAAHQFVGLTGAFVPGWLNEAYASFFEGCVILSDGSVVANRVPPGRLFPLAARMERGWMADAEDGVRGADGDWAEPERAPRLRTVVSGGHAWGPPWYAPTWGVVYFLYNARDEQGRTIWREALHAYYSSFRRSVPNDPVAHFEEILLAVPASPVRKIDELDEIWRTWILRLRDRETGKLDAGAELDRFADAAIERKEFELALEFLTAALAEARTPARLEKTAKLLERINHRPRAAALWRELRRELELAGQADTDAWRIAARKSIDLDPLAERWRRLREGAGERGIALARDYEARALPRMALEIARRTSAAFSLPQALAEYTALAERTGASLARWRRAYDGSTLRGWSGGGGAFQAYGELIRADVASDADRIATQMLACDVTFDGDFSLEAEIRIPADGRGGFAGQVAGLGFGRKDDENFHAVWLHPTGFLDVATNRGNVWTTLDHRQAEVGDRWVRLRIDVTGTSVDVYIDDRYVRSLEFAAEAAVRGGFGLLAGPGQAEFRRVRLLARDRHDPAGRIERRLAMQRIAADPALRQPGAFAGFRPPPLQVEWLAGGPLDWPALAGRPVLLAFWTPAQEMVIPSLAYYRHLAARGEQAGLAVILVCDAGSDPSAVRALFAAQPFPGAAIGFDSGGATLDAYGVRAGGFGLPRVLLVDRLGKVVFEGDPGLKAGIGWRPDDPPTFVDDPFAGLLRAN